MGSDGGMKVPNPHVPGPIRRPHVQRPATTLGAQRSLMNYHINNSYHSTAYHPRPRDGKSAYENGDEFQGALTKMYTLPNHNPNRVRGVGGTAQEGTGSSSTLQRSRTRRRRLEYQRRAKLENLLRREQEKEADSRGATILAAEIARLERRKQMAQQQLVMCSSRPTSAAQLRGGTHRDTQGLPIRRGERQGNNAKHTMVAEDVNAVGQSDDQPRVVDIRPSSAKSTSSVPRWKRQQELGATKLQLVGVPRATTPKDSMFCSHSARDMLTKSGMVSLNISVAPTIPGAQKIGEQRGAGQNGILCSNPVTKVVFCPIPTVADHRLSMTKHLHSKPAIGCPPSRGSDGRKTMSTTG